MEEAKENRKNLSALLQNGEYVYLMKQYLLGGVTLYQLQSHLRDWPVHLKHSHNELIMSLLHSASLNKHPSPNKQPQLSLSLESCAIRALSSKERQRVKDLASSAPTHFPEPSFPHSPLPLDFSLCSESKHLPSSDNLASRLRVATDDHSLSGSHPDCIPLLQSSLTLYLQNILSDTLDFSKTGKISLSDLRYTLASHPHPEATSSLHKHLANSADFDSYDDSVERGIDAELFSQTFGSPPPAPSQPTKKPSANPLKRSSAADSSFSQSFPNKRSRKPKAVVLSSDDDEDADGDPDADFHEQW